MEFIQNEVQISHLIMVGNKKRFLPHQRKQHDDSVEDALDHEQGDDDDDDDENSLEKGIVLPLRQRLVVMIAFIFGDWDLHQVRDLSAAISFFEATT